MALDIDKAFDTTLITLGDEATGKATIIVGDFDPSVGGQAAQLGSLFIRSDGTIWQKNGATDTDWGGGVGLDEFVKRTGDTMTGTLTMDASGGTVEVRIDNGTTSYGLGFDGTGTPTLVRGGVGGALKFFPDAVNPQIIFGSDAAGTANTFLDCDNNGGLLLNALHTGPVVIGQGGLIPEQAGVNLGTATAGERWGDTFLSNTDVDGTLETSGVATINGVGTGVLNVIDLYVGDAVNTPTYGTIKFGNAQLGRISFNAGNLDLDGTVILWNQGAPATSQIEYAFVESGVNIRFAIPKSGVGNATYNPRSMLIAGPAVLDDDIVTVSYWQTNNSIFHNLVCDTSGAGADLGIQNDCEIEGILYIDEIDHSTPSTDLTIAALTIESNGTLNVSNVTNYEQLVTGDDDIPNKKYVDDNGTTLTTINGDLIPTFIDTGRGNKVLSTSEITYHFAENNVANNDWINPGAPDADSSYIARKNGTIVGITGFCENAAVTKDIHLYIGVTDNGVIGTFTSGLLAQFNNNTNIDITQGDRIRLRGDATSGQIEDTLIQLYVRWRG